MLSTIVTVALCLWGVSALFDEGMILGKAGEWMVKKFPLYISKPLFFCPACMAGIWGTAFSVYSGYDIQEWITLVFGVCGLNFLTMKFLTQ